MYCETEDSLRVVAIVLFVPGKKGSKERGFDMGAIKGALPLFSSPFPLLTFAGSRRFAPPPPLRGEGFMKYIPIQLYLLSERKIKKIIILLKSGCNDCKDINHISLVDTICEHRFH